MDAHQSVVSPFTSSVVASQLDRQNSNAVAQNPNSVSEKIDINNKQGVVFIGVLEVYIHQARDIQNICIYHKQDVYAKLHLTSDPENTISTQTVNGGGKSPVFNEKHRLNVCTINSSLKCEIWMMSRVKNYLEDQLLGFALVPLSEILARNGQLLAHEFSLSSSNLFHSPSGFVQLSLSYSGSLPEVLEIRGQNGNLQDSEIIDSVSSDYDKIEFPDPKIVNENDMMVSEYFAIPCATLDSQSSESLGITSATDDFLSEDIGVQVVKSFSAGSINSVPKIDTPESSVSTNGSSSVAFPASSQSYGDMPGASNSPSIDMGSPLKDKSEDVAEAESDSSSVAPSNSFAQSVLNVNVEPPEQMVVQQDIVDMYMKSMQQFTDSLAKMKLPMEIENENGNSGSDQKLETPKRVFYGSRAFF
ncbi:hypothetical protein GIB67_014116 [Kingdonia uniflora]|uniref:C2 domain-containing protein n=1 Tax=Kingdonia uniflora TaxID=39325 RepID=A0A7J7N4B3_9MAGN|nr:hypothetical protein GIB67_014116 [Kingdonia uniflora]